MNEDMGHPLLTANCGKIVIFAIEMARRRAYRIVLKTLFWAIAISLLLVTALKWVPVRYTPLMLKRSIQHKEVRTQQRWVPLE